jgi:hypothetical protein
MNPIEILTECLIEYEKALQKSLKSYQEGKISKELHEIHKKNLEPKIQKYKKAIQILKELL